MPPLRERVGERPGFGERQSKPQSNTKLAVLSTILVSLITGVSWLVYHSKVTHVRVDDATLCPIDRAPPELVVILLDVSDSLSERQLIKIQTELTHVRRGLAKFARIETYAVSESSNGLVKPLIQLCNPGTGDDLKKLYQNPTRAKKRWEEFDQRLSADIEKLLRVPSSDTSPVMEGIQSSALRSFDNPGFVSAEKRLVIVSDLIQNVPGKLNQYQESVPFSEFKASAYFTQVRADLSNVAVDILYVVRNSPAQKWPEHRMFWEQYFAFQGAAVQSINPVFGAQ